MSLQNLSRQKVLNVLGIMNGTSLDGIDFVLTRISKGRQPQKSKIEYRGQKAFSFPRSLRERLLQAARREMKVNDLSLLHHDLGRFYAACFKKLPPRMRQADLIGLHGQTVFHQAPQATFQIGESSYLAAEAKLPVIHDFRVSDLALGGQGAPIATLFHQVAFARGQTISVHNLGGISNLSLISAKGVELAFDTGPANMLMDLCMQKISKGKKAFDRDGTLAARGQAHLDLVGSLLRHPYFRLKPPKSCGREEFGEEFFADFMRASRNLTDADRMATLCEFTAWSIVLSYKKFVRKDPAQIIFCGGGAHNLHLLKRIQTLMPESRVCTSEDLGWPVSSIEGAAFALLAAFRAWGWPSNLPKTTGATRAVSMGKITEI